MLNICLGRKNKDKFIENENVKEKPICYVLESKQPELSSEIVFSINGSPYKILQTDKVKVTTSLNTYIRENAKLRGTKFVCLEGGCGACIVSVRGINSVTKKYSTRAVNSCLFPVLSCHGLEITTIEGLGNRKDGYDDLQKRLAQFNGSQCGYCSPGMVMNMHSLKESNNGKVTKSQVEDGFSGNICRCTGYRPILDAFKSIAVDDIEDIGRMCSKTGKECAGTCSQLKSTISFVDSQGRKFVKSTTLNEVLDSLKQLTTNDKYILVHGNTAKGAYPEQPDYNVFIDVTSVAELHQVTIGNEIIVGGNLTLTDFLAVLTKAASQSSNFEYCKKMYDHVNLVANVPVRNIGSLAGNLMIKYQHNEFPSDIFLLLETVGAILEIIDLNGVVVQVKPIDFLKIDMNLKVIVRIRMPPLPNGSFIFQSYKIMPRAQNVIAVVNAAFLLNVNARSNITKATIVYEGINPKFIHASKTENFFSNKRLNDKVTLQGAIKALAVEIIPDFVLPDASAEYRKNLAVSLFYKFFLNISFQPIIAPKYQSGGKLLVRPISSGRETYQTNPSKYPLTQNVPKIEGTLQCAGELEYMNDVVTQPNELWAAFVNATETGLNIVGFDTNAALAYPGVRFFFSAKDIAGENNCMPFTLFGLPVSEEIFCSGKVLFNGQPAGVVLADDMETANKGASLVKIQYRKVSEENQKVLNNATNSVAAIQLKNTKDKKAVKNLDQNGNITFEGSFERGGQYHCAMETQVTVVIPTDLGLQVYCSTQWIMQAQFVIGKMLKVPFNTVNVEIRRIGGAYGSKITNSTKVCCAAALGAYLTNRPVRFVLPFEQNMESFGKRFPFATNYNVTVNGNGKILNLTNHFVSDLGCNANDNVVPFIFTTINNCYDPTNMKNTGDFILTESPRNTWCRAPGTLEGICIIENTMEHIAKMVNKDPVQVRLQNVASDSPLKQIIPDFLTSVEYYKRKADIDTFNAANRWRKRGISCVPMDWPLNYGGNFHTLVSIYQGDGSVDIAHGGIESGQGLNTKVVQVAAYILKLPMEMIRVKPNYTFTAPNDFFSSASQTSEVICQATISACKILLERLKPYLAKNSNWQAAVFDAYANNVDLQATFLHRAADYPSYPLYAVVAADVEVDLLTGNYIIQRVDLLEDVGDSISPGIDIGQIEGGFVMGMGYWLTEQLIYDNKNGKLLTNRTWNYYLPMAKDIPVDFRVNFLTSRPNPGGVLGSKAVGEPSTCLSIVCMFALRNALYSARKDAGLPDEYFQLDMPATPEHVFLAAGNKFDDYKLN